jgi:hypothetical protein
MPVLLIAEAELPEEAYAELADKELADKMTPVMRGQGLYLPCGRAQATGGRRDLGIRRDGQSWFDHNIKPNRRRRRAEAYVFPPHRGHQVGDHPAPG